MLAQNRMVYIEMVFSDLVLCWTNFVQFGFNEADTILQYRVAARHFSSSRLIYYNTVQDIYAQKGLLDA
jgi:hypothetical protein